MFRSYLTIARRSLQRRPGPTFINVFGLTVGLAVCLLIGLWVQHELSYDRFHPDADRIYRLGLDLKMQGQELRGPITSAPLGPTLVDNVPEVEAAARFVYDRDVGFRVDGRSFTDTQVIWADTSFFDLFSGFELLHGSFDGALEGDDAIVVTASLANRLYGRTEVVGKTMDLNGYVQTVRAVIADPPSASHMDFDAVGSIEINERMQAMWVGNNYYTYIRVADEAGTEFLQPKLDEMVTRYVAPQVQEFLGISMEDMGQEGARFAYYYQPLTDIHLRSNTQFEFLPNGSITYVYTFSIIALFILLLACINFMNLATARASERATEVGMRKTLGAGRAQLTGQFLGEALLITAVSTVAALFVATVSIPAFNAIAGTELSMLDALQPEVLLVAILLIGVVGMVAGSYPAFVLSRFQPALVLKSSDRHSSGGQDRRLRQGLVVFQFAVSIALIAGTLIVQQQFDYVQNKRLGVDAEHVVVVNRAWSLGEEQKVFMDRLLQQPRVMAAGGGSGIFTGDGISNTLFFKEGQTIEDAETLNFMTVTFGLVDALGAEIVAGRTFDPNRTSDSTAVVINQAMVERFGWEQPIGKQILEPEQQGNMTTWTVIGVVEDFHYQSMHYAVKPLILRPREWGQDVYIRLTPGDPSPVLAEMETLWNEMNPDNPFQYTFLDQSYAQLHSDTQRTGFLFTAFAGIAVLIACLGLFGLATYTAQRRIREIGIRKALGATVLQIVRLLSQESLILVAIAFTVAFPVTYFAMSDWLESFAYRIEPSTGVFVLAGVLATTVALVTVGYHAVRAARTRPAWSLRGE